jgi:hypothetical protein
MWANSVLRAIEMETRNGFARITPLHPATHKQLITINVPFVYMAGDAMILMRANRF